MTGKQTEAYLQKVLILRDDDCWLWVGYRDQLGYGRFGINRKILRTHRIAWAMENGPIPDGMKVCHHCDVRHCCNPAHMFLGTQVDNIQDMCSKGRQRTGTKRGYRVWVTVGERNPKSKITEADVREIRRRWKAGGISQGDLAKEYGISGSNISGIVRGEYWKHVT